MIDAAANGPGVGGTKTCVAYNPAARDVPSTASDIPVFLFIALFNVDRITYPESQNTGIDTINPVRFIAKGDLSFPVAFKRLSAIYFAAPVFSKKVPIIDPQAITMPMLFKVFPKPSERVFNIALVSSPLAKPIARDATISVKKGWILYLAVANIINVIVSTR